MRMDGPIFLSGAKGFSLASPPGGGVVYPFLYIF